MCIANHVGLNAKRGEGVGASQWPSCLAGKRMASQPLPEHVGGGWPLGL